MHLCTLSSPEHAGSASKSPKCSWLREAGSKSGCSETGSGHWKEGEAGRRGGWASCLLSASRNLRSLSPAAPPENKPDSVQAGLGASTATGRGGWQGTYPPTL